MEGRRLAALSIVVLLGAAVIGSASAPPLRLQSRAESSLTDLKNLEPGVATFVDAERLAARYGGRPWQALPQHTTCTPNDCYLYFAFARPRNNRGQDAQTLLGALIHVRNGYVKSIETSYECDFQSGRRALYDVRDTLSSQSLPSNEMYRWVSPGYGIAALHVDNHAVPWIVMIFLGPDANAQQRREAHAIDLSCLGRNCRCGPSVVVPTEILRPLEARMAGRSAPPAEK